MLTKTTGDRPPAVILGLGVNGLSMIRALGAAGIPVIGVYQGADEIGRWSRYCEAVRFPSVQAHRREFLDGLMQVGNEHSRPVLFPTSDEYVAFLSEHREPLATRFRFALPDAAILAMLLHKNGTHELARTSGVRTPATRRPMDASDIESVCGEMRFPCLIKPLDTFSVSFPGKNILVGAPQQLRSLYRHSPEYLGHTIVQEIVQGGDGDIFVCAAYCDASSQILAMYTGRKIRQHPPDYGITCLGESMQLPALERISTAFLQRIRYRGIAGLEFARDRRNGEFYFLELNARSSYYNRLPTDCGVNLAYVAYRDLIQDPIRQNRPQRDGVRWLDFRADLATSWWRWNRGELTCWAWLRTIGAARSFAYFDRRDLKPFVASVWLFAARIRRKALGRLRGIARSTGGA